MSNNLPDLANLPAQELREHKMKVLLLEPEAMAKQRLMDYAANLPTGDDDDVVT